MKTAYVIVDHHGDNGTVREGMILTDVQSKRFEELEKRGLIREATPDEAKQGYKPEIEGDPSKDEGDAKKASEPANKKAAAPANKAA